MPDEKEALSIAEGSKLQMLSLMERQNQLISRQQQELTILRLRVDTLMWALAEISGVGGGRPRVAHPASPKTALVTLPIPGAGVVPLGVSGFGSRRTAKFAPSKCVMCGAVFERTNPRQIYCGSEDCASYDFPSIKRKRKRAEMGRV